MFRIMGGSGASTQESNIVGISALELINSKAGDSFTAANCTNCGRAAHEEILEIIDNKLENEEGTMVVRLKVLTTPDSPDGYLNKRVTTFVKELEVEHILLHDLRDYIME